MWTFFIIYACDWGDLVEKIVSFHSDSSFFRQLAVSFFRQIQMDAILLFHGQIFEDLGDPTW